MTTHWKSILAAAAAGLAMIAAHADHDRNSPFNRAYGYQYDRYGNVYDRYGNLVEPSYLRPDYVAPRAADPLVQRALEERARELRNMDPRQREGLIEYERAQRGDYDGASPHPHSKNYSPG